MISKLSKLSTCTFCIFILLCTVGVVRADEFKSQLKNIHKIKGYDISGIEYTEEEDKLSAKFKDGDCAVYVVSHLKEGVYRRYIEVSSPTNATSKKCFENFNKYVLAKAFNKDKSDVVGQQAERISNDYTFSHFKEDSYEGNLKSQEGNIRLILYDCPLDRANCENLHTETTHY